MKFSKICKKIKNAAKKIKNDKKVKKVFKVAKQVLRIARPVVAPYIAPLANAIPLVDKILMEKLRK